MKTILITGGAGFIGSHLCDALINQDNKVICLDNFFTGSRKNIEYLVGNKNFTLIEHDVEQPYDFIVDQIYNLACPAAPVWYRKDPVKTVRTSILGAINALKLAKKNDCVVLQASTSEVYGDPLVHPQAENYWGNVNPFGPRACYDEGKRCAETLFFDYWQEYGVKIKIARIFNTYGPRMVANDGRAIPNFIVQALKDENLTIYGDGSQTRSFCYIDDMIRGLIAMMESADFVGPVNLGNGEEYHIKELADKIIDLTGSKAKIDYNPLPVDDPVKRQPDISLAKQKLDWQPEISLEQGLNKTIDYFKTQIY